MIAQFEALKQETHNAVAHGERDLRKSLAAQGLPPIGVHFSPDDLRKQSISFLDNKKASCVAHDRVLVAECQDVLQDQFHMMTAQQVILRLNTDRDTGLRPEVRAALLKEHGPNRLPEPKRLNGCVRFLKTQLDFFAILLWVAAIVCFISYGIQYAKDREHAEIHNVYLGVALVLINLMSGLLAFFQESKTSNILKSFANLIPPRCWVLIDGVKTDTLTDELVPGDIVFLQAGDKVPADLRIIEAKGLKVDMSSFTGEVEPQRRTVEPDNVVRMPLEAPNMAFYTTLVLSGEGCGVVVDTGARTMMGKLTASIAEQKPEPTPIQIEIRRFVKVISIIAICLGVLFFILSAVLINNLLEAFLFGIGIIVANVPEGLSLTIAVSLTLAAKRMKNKNILVKELSSVETLGSCSVICSDKTGTITMNQMNVSHLWTPRGTDLNRDPAEMKQNPRLCDVAINFNDGRFLVSPPSGTNAPLNFGTDPIWKVYYLIIALCSRAVFEDAAEEVGKSKLFRRTIGDASESGILRFTSLIIDLFGPYDLFELRADSPKIAEIPFNSSIKMQVSIHSLGKLALESFFNAPVRQLLLPAAVNHTADEIVGKVHLAVVKGAPERIIARCKYYMDHEGGVRPFDSKLETGFTAAYEAMGSMGERVLGLAFRLIPDIERYYDAEKREYVYDTESEAFPGLQDLIFAGLISLQDPPKNGVYQAVEDCKKAKIRVAMVTGDHYLTATAIARQVGIIDGDNIDMYVTPSTLKAGPENAAIEAQAVAQEANAGRGNKKRRCKKRGYKENINNFSRTNRALHTPFKDTELLCDAAVITGETLLDVDDIFLEEFVAIYPNIVFARTTPEQKLAIVRAYKENGFVVAVSGDGSNDAPALKCADIGVAMASGSDVAREAGNIILVDNSFDSIVTGIKEGRLIFENLRKALAYTVTSAVPQLIPFMLFVLFGFPNAMSGIMILLVDVFSDIWPAFAMSYEAAETDIMTRPPRNLKTDTLIDGRLIGYAYGQMGVIQAFALLTTFMLTVIFELRGRVDLNGPTCKDLPEIKYLKDTTKLFINTEHKIFYDHVGEQLQKAITNGCMKNNNLYDKDNAGSGVALAKEIFYRGQTASFVSVIESQFFDASVSRTRLISIFKQHWNWMMFGGLLLQITLCALFVYVPIFHTAFLTRPVSGLSWCWSLPFCVLILAYDEIRKLIIRQPRTPACVKRYWSW